MNAFEYIRAATAQSAIGALAKDNGAAFLAGGTNLNRPDERGVTAPSRLVDINDLPLAAVEKTATGNPHRCAGKKFGCIGA
jgi:xanthine dehydrogenase YagS FAD-binding subunit